MRLTRCLPRLALALAFTTPAATATADMVLTAAGVADGFVLTRFATGFPSTNGIGPLAVAFAPDGSALISTYTRSLYRLPDDSDNQVVSPTKILDPTADFGGLSRLGQYLYGLTGDRGGHVVQFNPATAAPSAVYAAPTGTLFGMETNFADGTLIVASSSGLYEIHRDSRPMRQINAIRNLDGITIDPTGTHVYGAGGDGYVYGFNVATGVQTFRSNLISGRIDGLALGSGSLAGDLFVNTNAGQLIELNLASRGTTVLGTGGTRGDYVSVDPNDGSLLLSQTDRILRLTAPAGGGFTASVPEPASAALLALGLSAGVARALIHRRRSGGG